MRTHIRPGCAQVRFWVVSICVLLSHFCLRAEDQTYVYTVQITAAVQTSPPSITLSWPQDPYGANNYTVYRKTKTATSWGTGTVLSGATTTYVDNNVSVGSAYEYQIVKASTIGYRGYGYIYSGINAPLTESRGKLILVVATNSTASLSSELQRLQSDLVGDGWTVVRHDVSSNDTPASVKNIIVADYNSDPANVSALFLFGHVPVFHTGNLNYDGHQARPMPSDSYYADVSGTWDTNVNYLPSDVELMTGRVDFFDMPGNGAIVPWPSETELLRNYLNKDHAWRQKLITAPRRALMGNTRGDEGGEAVAASGYRAFAALCGTANLTEANVDSGGANRWISYLGTNSYLWAYGCGGGLADGCGGLGTNYDGAAYWAFSTDVVGVDAKAVFVMVFGSWMGNFDDEDDFIRSYIATPSYGLAACMAGRPHWYLHHMGLGETIGYSTRLSMNNSGVLYQNQSNLLNRAIYLALMGDPSLRQDIIAPVSNLIPVGGPSSVALNWSASADSVVGYNVYRSTSPSGPFARVNANLITGTSYIDTGLSANTYTYMVRAVALQTTPSGTYFNPSQGTFATTTVSGSVPPIWVSVGKPTNNNLTLTWTSQNGIGYHVQYKNSSAQSYWSNLSTAITATGITSSFTDTNISSHPPRLYRVTSP